MPSLSLSLWLSLSPSLSQSVFVVNYSVFCLSFCDEPLPLFCLFVMNLSLSSVFLRWTSPSLLSFCDEPLPLSYDPLRHLFSFFIAPTPPFPLLFVAVVLFSPFSPLSVCFHSFPCLQSVKLARAGCKKTQCLLHYPRKIKFIHSFIHSLSLSLSLTYYSLLLCVIYVFLCHRTLRLLLSIGGRGVCFCFFTCTTTNAVTEAPEVGMRLPEWRATLLWELCYYVRL